MRFIFAHGLEGSPEGRKITAFKQAGLPVEAPDHRGMPLQQRIDRTLEVIGDDKVILGGSSYGGLVAAWIGQHHPDKVAAVFLCAPALGLAEAPNTDPEQLVAPPGIQTVVMHGSADDVCPIEHSRAYWKRSGDRVDFREVRGKHPLARHVPKMVELLREMIAAA